MTPILLAIDDDPGRYDYLRVLLDDRSRRGIASPRLVVATCPAYENRRALVDGLADGGVLTAAVAADSLGVEHAWLGHLWFWSVL